jgi:hypothetical protein
MEQLVSERSELHHHHHESLFLSLPLSLSLCISISISHLHASTSTSKPVYLVSVGYWTHVSEVRFFLTKETKETKGTIKTKEILKFSIPKCSAGTAVVL